MGINIAQKTKEFGMDSVKFGKVHGQTKIELYDVNKRIKKVYRDENVFQSAIISKYMRSLGECTDSPYNNSTFRGSYDWQNLVGGIFLFRDAITVGDHYMSVGNQMIGNGSFEIVNGNVPTELGSYNSVESSASGSAITQVYDFATSQANGTISSVCLTSQTGGYIGYGNNTGESTSTKYRFDRNAGKSNFVWHETRLNDYGILYGNYTYEFMTRTGGSLEIRKTRHSVLYGSVFNGYSETLTYDLSVIGNPLNLGDRDRAGKVFYNDGKIEFIPHCQQFVESGGNAYFYEFNPSDQSVVLKTVVNSSSHRFDIGGYYNYFGNISNGVIGNIAHGLLFGRNAENGTKATVIRISDSVLMAELDYFAFSDQNDNDYASELPNGLILLSHNNSGAYYSIFDGTNDRIINGLKTGLNGLSYDSTNDVLWYFEGEDGCINNPLYLATINNLQTPVTKTAAQTMKVTYTLTEESE